MIKFGKWRKDYKNGTVADLAEVRISFFLTREELAGALIAAEPPETEDELAELAQVSKTEAERRIRAVLKDSASRAYYWQDAYSDGVSEVDEENVLKAALVVIDKLTA